MRVAALALVAIAQSAAIAVFALARSDYLALGLAGTAMATSALTAWYVYANVARARRRAVRVGKLEKGASEIEQRLAGK